MRTVIYDYDNMAVEIFLQDKPIRELFVEVKSGDEILTVDYEDGTSEHFDSCQSYRLIGFDDGSYIVPKEKVEAWLSWEPVKAGTYSYDRQRAFW